MYLRETNATRDVPGLWTLVVLDLVFLEVLPFVKNPSSVLIGWWESNHRDNSYRSLEGPADGQR